MAFDEIVYDTSDGFPPRPPRLAELLKTNDCPLGSDLAFIREEVAHREARLALIEKDVKAAQFALSHHVMKHELVRQDLEELQALSNPI